MAEDTYQSIQDEIKAVEKNAESEVEALEKKKRLFIDEQTFTGKELMQMRQILLNGGSRLEDPRLDYILERILKDRNNEY
jgi:hypothetical protein